MQWVKLQVSLRHNRAFRRLSSRAKTAFFGALMAVAEYEQGGALTMRQGPLTSDELSEDLMLTGREARLAVDELVNAEFFGRRDDGIIIVTKFNEKTETTAAGRMRKRRERLRLEAAAEALEHVTEAVTKEAHVHRNGSRTPRVTVTRNSSVYKEEEKEYPVPSSTTQEQASVAENTDGRPEWVKTLFKAIALIAERELRSLSVDEIYLAAQYHCVLFGNCTKTEARNKAQATKVAAALSSMARNENYGALTVKEYVHLARQTHEKREKTPWFDPWLIRAVVKFAAA